MSQISSDELMRLLIPDGKVRKVAQISGLSESLLYQERRSFGNQLTDTGTRNTIARLDLFAELALSHNANAVRLLGERYLNLYHNSQTAPPAVSVNDLLAELGNVSRECGEAVAVLAARQSIKKCCVEVAQAKEALERCLQIVAALECEEK